MNTELLIRLGEELEEVKSVVVGLEKAVNALKINDQRRLNANNPIPPGIACKVAFDKSGLIIKGTGLEVSDIPQLGIDKINNLKQSLDDKASTKDFTKFKVEVTEMIKPAVKELGAVAGTGTKVNYNSDGRIISTSDLVPNDIPTLPIEKIAGLSDIISSWNTRVISKDNEDTIPNIKVSPGTYAKVTIDMYGRVLTGEKIGMSDIPTEIVTRLNQIEERMINFASQRSLDNITDNLTYKIEKNDPIIPGTYTKIKVDSKGLVTFGDKLTVKDLPELSITDINGLEKALKEKASSIELTTLTDTVSSLVSSLNQIGEITGIKNELQHKASDDEVKSLSSKMNKMQNTVNSLVNRMPSDMIETQLQQITNELSILGGKISAIEGQLGIKNTP